MEEKKKEEKISEALLKVALGYQVAEVTEEYAEVDGTLKLTKRKKTKKDVPPDLKAVQILLGSGDCGTDYGDWSDEDLEEEKRRLLFELQLETTGKTETKTRVKTVEKMANDGGRVALNEKSRVQNRVNGWCGKRKNKGSKRR